MYQKLQKRIRQIMEVEAITPSRFADKIKVNRSRLSHIFGGRNNPSLDIVYNILDAFPEISSAWLLTGEGQMKRGSSGLPAHEEHTQTKTIVAEPKAEEEEAAVYSTREQLKTEKIDNSSQPQPEPGSIKAQNVKKIREIVVLYTDDSYEIVGAGAP